MNQHNNGGPAFPNPALANECFQPQFDMSGLTMRDYFAAKAMQSLINIGDATRICEDAYSKWAYKYADAMLRAREDV